jgi:hypothetical protein
LLKTPKKTRSSTSGGAKSGALLEHPVSADSELLQMASALAEFPPELRAAMLAILRAAGGRG